MDSGLIKNLGPSPDLTPAVTPRAASPDNSPAKSERSFDSVLAERAQPAEPAKADESSEAADAPDLTAVTPITAPPAIKLKAAPAADASDTELAWAEFLTDMDEQLDVKPTDVLGAFEKLSEEDLRAKPEDTTDQMVAAMGLTGQAALMAKQMLAKLIARTDPAPEVAVASAAPAKLDQFTALDRAIEAPVVQAPAKAAASNVDLAQISPTTDEPATVDAESGPTKGPKSERNVTLDARDESAPTPATAPARAAAPTRPDGAAINALVEQMTPVKGDEAATNLPRVDQIVRDLVNRQTATPAGTPSPAPPFEDRMGAPTAEDDAESLAPAPRSASQALDDLIGKAMKHSADQQASSEHDRDDESDLDAESLTNADARAVRGPEARGTFATKLATETNGPAAAGPAAPTDLIENARLMVRNGGGEMKVTVNSEVGEIEMKVSVSGGKVSVQMVAETDEAKRMLETQLGDLKTQLTAHQLQVDKLQVDTSSNLGQQADQDQSRRAPDQRAAPGDGWNQMNQQNRGQSQGQARRQPSEPAVPRGYGNTTARPSVAAVAAPAAGSTNSRRLNVVA